MAKPKIPGRYVFLSFFRDSPADIRNDLRKRGNADLFWGNMELAAFAAALFVLFLFNWRYVLFYFLPFFYLGHCFSYLNGYFRHYGADPDKPIAWGVSSYGKLTTGSFSTTATTPSIISARKFTGRRWNLSISRSKICNGRRMSA